MNTIKFISCFLITVSAFLSLPLPAGGGDLQNLHEFTITTEQLKQLEDRLQGFSNFKIQFQISVTGAYNSYLEGYLQVSGDEQIDIKAEGNIQRDRALISFISDGEQMKGGSQRVTFEQETPKHLKDAVILGFVRLGIYHNILRIYGGNAPESADTTAQDIIQVENVTAGPRTIVSDREVFPLVFDMRLRNGNIGSARLWIHAFNQLPFRREHDMRIPEGTINVVEVYIFAE